MEIICWYRTAEPRWKVQTSYAFSLCDNWSCVLVGGPAVGCCLSFTFTLLFNCLSSRKRCKDKSFHELVVYCCYTNSPEFSNLPPRSTFILLNNKSLNLFAFTPLSPQLVIFLNEFLLICVCGQYKVNYDTVTIVEIRGSNSVLGEISGSHRSEYEDDCLLGCCAVQSGRSLPTFLRSPDDGGSELLWNVGKYIPDYTAQYPRRQSSSYSSPWEPEISLCKGLLAWNAWLSFQHVTIIWRQAGKITTSW
jgi:hypothetical protein